MMKKTNFQMGENKFGNVLTTNQHNFQGPPENFKAVTIDAATKADLRKSHWTLGGFGNTYLSTFGASYQKRNGSLSQQDKRETQNKIGMMRGHNFNIGTGP